ncbi:BadF/BadG/BcrA/BcrD ATPase family protein [soil metagenome]
MSYIVGIDGGGTRTTLALADQSGHEILRRTGPAGLVDPRRPTATAEMLTALVRESLAAAGLEGPATALCAGLAGVGNAAEREMVESALVREGVAQSVCVRSDGETALHGALSGEAGILLIAGTGSIAYGRSEDGRVEKCGGWGMIVGDEGSGYALGRAALGAALSDVDGRGPPTRLRPVLLNALGLSLPDAIPPWAGRAEKSEIAALAVHVLRLAEEGDSVAERLARASASALADHAAALVRRLAPWTAPIPVVFHGGVARDPLYERLLMEELAELDVGMEPRDGVADAVTGAVRFACELALSHTAPGV